MANNLAYINTIQISILIIVGIMVCYNCKLTLKQKKLYIFTFALVSLISVIQYNCFIFNGTDKNLRILVYILNYLGMALAPFVLPLFAYAIMPTKDFKWPITIISLFELFLLISLPFDLVFKVDSANYYSRGPLFYVYTLSFFVGLGYLLLVTIRMAKMYRNTRPFVLYLIFSLVTVALLIQIIFPSLHSTWLFITALAVVYYEYCNNLWHQIDGLTNLLSQESFMADTKVLKRNGVLVIFDIDKFKLINDTYGHSIGDEYLKAFGEKLLKVYSDYGYCYRVGGDEFVAILDEKADVYKLNQKFSNEINIYNKYYDTKPDVSFGISIFKKGDDILKVKDLADERMYKLKRRHQEQSQIDKK